MKLNSNNGASNLNNELIDTNLSFKKFVVAFANKHLAAQVNFDESGLENNDDIKPRQILSKLENNLDLINLLNKVKSTLPAEHQDLNALYELNAQARNSINHIEDPDYSNAIHRIIVNLNSMNITPLQRIEIFYLVLFHNFGGTIITHNEIETKNSQGGYKAALSRYQPSLASLSEIYNDDGNEILKMSDYEDTNGCRNLLKREEDIKSMKCKNHVYIARGYASLTKIFLGYLPEIKDYHEFIWEALDMLGDGVIDNCVTPATFVGMDGALEKVVLDSEFGKHIIKQFYRFTKTNKENDNLESVNIGLDKFIGLLRTIIEPEKYCQQTDLFVHEYNQLKSLCEFLARDTCRHRAYQYSDDYITETKRLMNKDKLHIWLHIKSFFYWVFNKKTYDETYHETVIYELKKCFCKVCREALRDCRGWLMRTDLQYTIKNHAGLNVITNGKNRFLNKNRINRVNRLLEPKLAESKDGLQPKQNLREN